MGARDWVLGLVGASQPHQPTALFSNPKLNVEIPHRNLLSTSWQKGPWWYNSGSWVERVVWLIWVSLIKLLKSQNILQLELGRQKVWKWLTQVCHRRTGEVRQALGAHEGWPPSHQLGDKEPFLYHMHQQGSSTHNQSELETDFS